MKPEQAFWKNDLAGQLKPYGHFCRVETGATCIGMPDVSYSIDGNEGFLELKVCEIPNKGFTIRPAQYRWIFDRTHNGGNVWLLGKAILGKNHVVYMLMKSTVVLVLRRSHANSPIHEWGKRATRVWEDKIDYDDLVKALSINITRNHYA